MAETGAVPSEGNGAGAFPAPTFDEFRRAVPPDSTSRVDRCEIRINLMDDLERALYCYHCTVTAVGERPDAVWEALVPSAREHVRVVSAEDAWGGLEY